jgi:hypothetical protein
MAVTTYQDYVRPAMIPTEGRGKVYLRFENLPKAGGPTLGPYPYVVLSFESVRVGPDKVEVARWHRGFWNLSKDNTRWTDVTIFSNKDNNEQTEATGRLRSAAHSVQRASLRCPRHESQEMARLVRSSAQANLIGCGCAAQRGAR